MRTKTFDECLLCVFVYGSYVGCTTVQDLALGIQRSSVHVSEERELRVCPFSKLLAIDSFDHSLIDEEVFLGSK